MDGTGGASSDTGGSVSSDSGGTAPDGGGGTSSGGTGTGTGGAGTGGVATGGASTGGASTGGAGTGGSTGGASGGSDGFGGEGGLGGMGGMGGGGPCVSELPTMQVQARSDTGATWDDGDFDASAVQIALECPVALVSVTWPHEPGYGDFADANYEYTQFNLEVINGTDVDYTGKQLNLRIRLVDDEIGPNATEAGYDVYIGLTENAPDYTEVKTEYPAQNGELWDPGDSDEVVFVVPDNVPEFDPTDVYKIFIRIHNKYWDGPEFDYVSSKFEISEFSVTDAP